MNIQTIPKIKVIEKAHFEIVRGCQLRCVGCPNSTLQPKVKRIEVEDFDRCLRNIDVDHIIYFRLFNYGEPLLHHDLPGILARIPDQSWRTKVVEISTNAQFVDWPSFEQAISLGILSQLIVSCDGDGSPEDYERLRPPSRWEKLIEFLDRASEIRDRLSPGLGLFTRTICVDPEAQARWRAILEPRGWIPEFREWGYSPDSLENMTGRELRFRTGICAFQKTNHRLYVDWDGTVVPCCAHPRAGEFGNLLNQSFNDILFGERRAEFIAAQGADRKKMLVCNSCEY